MGLERISVTVRGVCLYGLTYVEFSNSAFFLAPVSVATFETVLDWWVDTSDFFALSSLTEDRFVDLEVAFLVASSFVCALRKSVSFFSIP